MVLSRFNLKNITASVQLPADTMFDLPEKVLQFGTGVLLRGLPDYFIDKANRQGIFNGRIVVVKSTDGGDALAFDKQDGLYTICVRGIENGIEITENIISAAISRVLSAKSEWAQVLECAHNPEMQIVISNTTEVGIQLLHEDIRNHPPTSFPGKLLAFLYERFKAFNGSAESGMVILPTELVTDNGKKLESIVFELAHLNGLADGFIEWLETSNTFCNTLVDRIVPGKPKGAALDKVVAELGYNDDLLTMSEVYRLWAIEGDDHVKEVLSFAQADDGVVITNDMTLQKELKLRMLNGTHTLSCGLAFLKGFGTVKNAMDDTNMTAFVENLMLEEIAPAIPYKVSKEVAAAFGAKVLDRFRNPNIEHFWLSITMQYTSKLKMRVLPLIKNYIAQFNTVPENMSTGFAAYLLFMKATRTEGGKYFGTANGAEYQITDDEAGFFFEQWKKEIPEDVVEGILSHHSLWGSDLCALPGFFETVAYKLRTMTEQGVSLAFEKTPLQKIAV
ncbi:MAG: tagaturonate reductase [Bacteroidota bacterium]